MKRKIRKYTKFNLKRREIYIDVLKATGNPAEAARKCNICWQTAYNYKNKHPDFAVLYENSIEEGIDDLLGELRRRAKDGVDEPVFYQGVECGIIKKYSDSLGMFLVKGRRKEYCDRQEITIPGGLRVEFTWEGGRPTNNGPV